jgi:hypothetical protein
MHFLNGSFAPAAKLQNKQPTTNQEVTLAHAPQSINGHESAFPLFVHQWIEPGISTDK